MRSRGMFIVWATALGVAVNCGESAVESGPEQCTAAGDEDGDGLADCDDPDCWTPESGCAEVCTGGDDEDGDELVDCADPDCWTPESGCVEICTGGEDEDGDGLVDCADDDCWTPESGCAEICTGGEDEDGDGLVDCEDDDCWTAESGCVEVCTGGEDEDGDGLVDCDDDDCKDDDACPTTYAQHVQPIFLQHCTGASCHTNEVFAGGISVERYDDMPKPSLYCELMGLTKGACTLVRINDGTMPKDCIGCVTEEEKAIIAAWIDDGIPP